MVVSVAREEDGGEVGEVLRAGMRTGAGGRRHCVAVPRNISNRPGGVTRVDQTLEWLTHSNKCRPSASVVPVSQSLADEDQLA